MTTPANVFLCGRNLLSEVQDSDITQSGGTALSTMPLANLKRSSRARVWRNNSDAVTDLIVSCRNTTSERVNFVHLSRHNLETAATWRVRMYTSYDASGAASYDTGDVAALDAATLGDLDWGVEALGGRIFNGFPRFSTAYFMENTATVINSIRVTITDTGNSSNYLEASSLYFGRGVELDHNWENLHGKWSEGTKLGRTDGGSILSDGAAVYRDIQLDLKWVTEADRAELMDLLRSAGMRRDWFVAGKPGVGGEEERDSTGIFRLSAMPNISTLFYSMYSSQLKFTEA